MPSYRVSVKWIQGRKTFDNVEINTDESAEVFLSQLWTLTGVPIERQKVLIKGKAIKQDSDLSSLPIKDGSSLTLMGAAEELPPAPTEVVRFIEDESGEVDEATVMHGLPVGLANLGNTCYLNSTLQTLRCVPELRNAILHAPVGGERDLAQNFTESAKHVLEQLEASKSAVNPTMFLETLRRLFPQFAERGEQGIPMQQDAEECMTNILTTLSQSLPSSEMPMAIESGNGHASSFGNKIADLFGIGLKAHLDARDGGDSEETYETSLKLTCHISQDTSHLVQGIEQGLTEEITKRSASLGHETTYTKTTRIDRLPKYLIVQFMRFFWRQDSQKKAKILKSVKFPKLLDTYSFATPDLKATLDVHRAVDSVELEEADALNPHPPVEDPRGLAIRYKTLIERYPESSNVPRWTTALSECQRIEKLLEEHDDAASDSTEPWAPQTGRYELCGVLTHQGRVADGGHYMAWIKQDDGRWAKFDDDKVTIVNESEIEKLSGGGDWHMLVTRAFRQECFF